jgi:hypothetical protein
MKRETFFVLLVAAGVVAIDEARAAAQTPGAASGQQQTAVAIAGQAGAAEAQSPAPPRSSDGEATLTSTPGSKALGISILGNQEAPTSLVIVPWKSSELGTGIGNTPTLDDSRQAVDKDVFLRSLRYYEISTGTNDHDGGTAGGRSNAAAKK